MDFSISANGEGAPSRVPPPTVSPLLTANSGRLGASYDPCRAETAPSSSFNLFEQRAWSASPLPGITPDRLTSQFRILRPKPGFSLPQYSSIHAAGIIAAIPCATADPNHHVCRSILGNLTALTGRRNRFGKIIHPQTGSNPSPRFKQASSDPEPFWRNSWVLLQTEAGITTAVT